MWEKTKSGIIISMKYICKLYQTAISYGATAIKNTK